jgi:predicted MPP superfamily phosphohydrolase
MSPPCRAAVAVLSLPGMAPERLNDRPLWTPPQPLRPARGICGLWGLPRVVLHRVVSRRWTAPPLRIAVLSDPHVCRPWVRPQVMVRIVEQVQGLGADLILLAGDFLPDANMPCRHLAAPEIVPLFAGLTAPLGVYSVLGNHDHDHGHARGPRFPDASGRPNAVEALLASQGLHPLTNRSVALRHGGRPVWLAGLDSQRAFGKGRPGNEDPDAAFADVPADAPCILLAHEPDYFARGDDRALLQISGHTHGGQFVLFGRRPMTPSHYGDRYSIGHIAEQGRDLIVSAGLGYSGLPLRFGVPPELTCIELGAAASGEEN